MKIRLTTVRGKPVLILAVLLLLTSQSASAQVATERTTGNVHTAISENSDTSKLHLNGTNPVIEDMDKNLLNELLHSDSPDKTRQTEKEDLCGSNIFISKDSRQIE
jgi:hypothetical protein